MNEILLICAFRPTPQLTLFLRTENNGSPSTVADDNLNCDRYGYARSSIARCGPRVACCQARAPQGCSTFGSIKRARCAIKQLRDAQQTTLACAVQRKVTFSAF